MLFFLLFVSVSRLYVIVYSFSVPQAYAYYYALPGGEDSTDGTDKQGLAGRVCESKAKCSNWLRRCMIL